MKPLVILCLVPGLSYGTVTLLTPTDINQGDTNTASYSDANVTLTPLIGTTASTFNANATRLGIDGQGTNNNAFNDPDLDANNGNEERLRFDFSPTVGLSQISFDFSRADGPGTGFSDDGVIITGFVADPSITFVSLESPAATIPDTLFYAYDAVSGSVRINISASDSGGNPVFNGNDIGINFDPNASLGQTLLLSATDTNQAANQAQTGGQIAITGISYEVVPEPSAALLGALGLLGLLRRRR